MGQWVPAAETAPGPPVQVAFYVACGEESGGAYGWDVPQKWCLRHAAASGHTAFETTATSFLRASLQEVL